MNAGKTFAELPCDILRIIFDLISVDDLHHCTHVCSRWRSLLHKAFHVLSSPFISGRFQHCLRLTLSPGDPEEAVHGILSSLSSLSLCGSSLAASSLYLSSATEATLSLLPTPPHPLHASLSSLSTLCLRSTPLTATAIAQLCRLPSLQSLVLHDSPLTFPSAFSSLQLHGTSLRHLAFQHVELVSESDDPQHQHQHIHQHEQKLQMQQRQQLHHQCLQRHPHQQQHHQKEQQHYQQQEEQKNEAGRDHSCLAFISHMSSLRSLAFTNVTNIPPSSLHHLSSLSLLTSLSIRAIATTSHSWRALEPSLLSLLPSLSSSLHSLDLRNGFPLSKPLLSSLACLPSLQHFASHCTSAYQLNCIALNLPSLSSLSLSLHGITASCSTDLRQAVRRLGRLHSLELDGGDRGQAARSQGGASEAGAMIAVIKSMVKDVAVCARGLTSLSLLHCLEQSRGEEVMREVAFMPSVRELGVAFSRLQPAAFERLKASRSLDSLDVRYSNVGDEHIRVIAQITRLTCLQLTGCSEGSKGRAGSKGCEGSERVSVQSLKALRGMARGSLKRLVLSCRQHNMARTVLPPSVLECDETCW